MGKRKKREMRAVIHRMIVKEQYNINYPTEASIVGWLSYLQSVDTESYTQMLKYYEKLKQN